MLQQDMTDSYTPKLPVIPTRNYSIASSAMLPKIGTHQS